MAKKGITGHDEWVVTEALATALVAIILSSLARPICAGSCEPMLLITTRSERTGRWTKMLRSLARFSGSEQLIHTGSSADFITIMSGFRFSVHTGVHFESYAGEARILKTTRARVWLLILTLALVALPATAGPYLLGQMTYMFITLMAVYGLYVTVGMAGQINTAQSAFVGVGAFVTAKLSGYDVPVFVVIPAAARATGLVSIVFALPAARVKGLYLALTTLSAQVMFGMLRGEKPPNVKTSPSLRSGLGKRRLMGAPQPRSAQAGVRQTLQTPLDCQSRLCTSDSAFRRLHRAGVSSLAPRALPDASFF